MLNFRQLLDMTHAYEQTIWMNNLKSYKQYDYLICVNAHRGMGLRGEGIKTQDPHSKIVKKMVNKNAIKRKPYFLFLLKSPNYRTLPRE